MTQERSNPLFHENLYRPVYELNKAYVSLAAGVVTFTSSVIESEGHIGMVGFGITTILTAQCGHYTLKAIPLVKRQCKIFFNKIEFEDIKAIRQEHMAKENILNPNNKKKGKNKIFIGNGFEWGVEHANRSYQIQGLYSDKQEVKLPLFLKPFVKKWRKETLKLGGKPWIDGVGDAERQYVDAETFFGHSMIMGNVGTGKTTMFILLSLAMIHKGYTVIVLDPKNDSSWRKALQAEMEHFGKGEHFHYFHPSKPSTSCTIDPIKNWNRPTEIAERIASIMVESGKEDSFIRFNWNVINSTVNAMLYAGIQPQIKSIARYVTTGKTALTQKCLERHYAKCLGEDWETQLSAKMSSFGKTRLEQMLNYYQQVVSQQHQSPEVDGIIQLLTHNAEHMQKMTANLLPIFSVLTSTPMDELISPEEAIAESLDARDEDTRYDTAESESIDYTSNHIEGVSKKSGKIREKDSRYVDTSDIVENGGLLYMALDSLSDTKTAGYLSKLVLADIAAVAGSRYNFSEGRGRRVAVFVDEVHAAIAGNDALLNLLAQGRAAFMQMFIATQTKADIEAKTDPATANRVLGLCNNFFSMRANDTSTQEYASSQFGEVPITSQQITLGQSSGNTNDMTDFGSSYAERLTQQNDKAFNESLLGSLPILQYVARLADGRTIKAKVPVIQR
ncbi:hypothetical protein D0907_20040 (plasmid) [Pseudoalteromonas lipolytica]|uniref:TraD/TraG TraM recognition site domain-containing protein n=1 Tax=Pseudoalteromonas lipolytica TaxID=570156 RepID=A0AAD0WEK2_9GAMM|nr:type IV secretion system DNA-binding domain-containing protein [Pseudoalteromonas donghaensis]AXV67628.1 hypothetical protein D0907_20040 [Pseudoalteromonas donghaensis]